MTWYIADGVFSKTHTPGAAMFRADPAAEEIIVPDGVTEIGNRAFACCMNLQYVTLPESVTYIGEDAFSECENLTIFASVNSYAHTYAQTVGIAFNIEKNE